MFNLPRFFRFGGAASGGGGATSAAGGAASLNPIGLGIAGLQTALGVYQEIKGKADMKKLLAQRTAFKTPEEIFKILNSAENNMQGDPLAYSYETNQVDRATDSVLGTLERTGISDPNAYSAILDQKLQSYMKIGDDFHKDNMAKWSAYVNALGAVAENKTAEWKSKQDIIKDKMQAAGADMQSGAANISGGINTALSTLSSDKISDLYKRPKV